MPGSARMSPRSTFQSRNSSTAAFSGWHNANSNLSRLAQVRTVEGNRRNWPSPHSLRALFLRRLRNRSSDETAALTHADWLGLLVDRELTHRRDKRLAARLRYARLRQQASVEDVDYRAPRGFDRALFHKLTNSEWIDAHDNLILCGPTGVGKSWLACALGHKACRDNRSVLYQRVPKLFPELALARGDGRYARILRSLTGVQLLILDDWGLEPLDAGARRDLYEILEERYGRRSTDPHQPNPRR